jgi:hypothetical protein
MRKLLSAIAALMGAAVLCITCAHAAQQDGWVDHIGGWLIEHQVDQEGDHCYLRRDFASGYSLRFTWHQTADQPKPWSTFVVAPSPGRQSKYTLRLDLNPSKRHYTATMLDMWPADGKPALVMFLDSGDDAFVATLVGSISVDLRLNGKRLGTFPLDRASEAMLRFRDCQRESRAASSTGVNR